METLIWLIAFVVLLLIEVLTLGLTTIWFAGGALVAALLSFLGLGLSVQIVGFVLVSVALLLLTRPWAVKHFNTGREKTGAELLIGQQALVIQDVDTLQAAGQVEVNGQIWSAKTADVSGCIPKGRIVEILEIQGVKLVVKEKEDKPCC